MGRVNQPDTLVSELREIQRRLRLLEGGHAATAAMFSATAAPTPSVVPFLPARPADWPGTPSASWVPLVRLLTAPGALRVVVETLADAAATGQVRVLVDGVAAEGVLAVAPVETRYTVPVTAESALTELVVEARRTGGSGLVRAVAFAVS
ncbi:hypothetical protein ACFWY9_14960 [Amycolatopsis sp. NPDC059027]|uniref:hypothetical protein n=1 Tax=unclassified Amycolatopsis TaxID=2618356 RepID=UPI00366BD60D